MIAADTSSLLALLNGKEGGDVELIDRALAERQLALPPVVVAEMLSFPAVSSLVSSLITELPCLEPGSGFWERAGVTRRTILALGLRARLADTLVAQSCLDYALPLVTRDRDFRHFAVHTGLRLFA